MLGIVQEHGPGRVGERGRAFDGVESAVCAANVNRAVGADGGRRTEERIASEKLPQFDTQGVKSQHTFSGVGSGVNRAIGRYDGACSVI